MFNSINLYSHNGLEMDVSVLPRGIYMLFLLNSNDGEAVIGKTRLEKLMFLISKEVLIQPGRKITPKDYAFRADRFGPFTEEVYDDFETLKDIGLVEYEENNQIFKISEKGTNLANKLIKSGKLPSSLLHDIDQIKKRYNKLDLNKLLFYVYKNYDKYTYESEIRGKILGE